MTQSNRAAPRHYEEDFKLRAVEMTLSGRWPTEVARDLGIPRSCLTRWRKFHLEDMYAAAPAGMAKPSEQDAEIGRLRKELAYVTEQRDMLKKRYASSGNVANREGADEAPVLGSRHVEGLPSAGAVALGALRRSQGEALLAQAALGRMPVQVQ